MLINVQICTFVVLKETAKHIVMKTYKLICNDFGWRFSFNADNEKEAELKKKAWCRYHSFDCNDFRIEETEETKWIHNEYVD